MDASLTGTALRTRRRVGIALLLAGVLCNPWIVEAVVSRDGRIDSQDTRLVLLACGAVSVLYGVVLLTCRQGRGSVFALLTWTTLLSLVAFEVALRVAGLGPWDPPDVHIQIEPGGHFFQAHPTRGFAMLPGHFDVTMPDGYRFGVTHADDALRITRPADKPVPAAPQGVIWVLGCSFTHGWTVEDDESFPWVLQQALPEHDVRNLGVDAYGTLQSLIQFREELGAGPAPDIAVVAYASFHDVRNTFVRLRRKDVAPHQALGPLSQPFARLAPDGSLTIRQADSVYTEFPLMRRSATVHLIERVYDSAEETFARSPEVTLGILAAFQRTAREHGVELVVAGLTSDDVTAGVRGFCEAADILFADISVDTSRPEYNNLPHDPHPSALAQALFADRLKNHLLEHGLLVPKESR